jgi:hypothetical protein
VLKRVTEIWRLVARVCQSSRPDICLRRLNGLFNSPHSPQRQGMYSTNNTAKPQVAKTNITRMMTSELNLFSAPFEKVVTLDLRHLPIIARLRR